MRAWIIRYGRSPCRGDASRRVEDAVALPRAIASSQRGMTGWRSRPPRRSDPKRIAEAQAQAPSSSRSTSLSGRRHGQRTFAQRAPTRAAEHSPPAREPIGMPNEREARHGCGIQNQRLRRDRRSRSRALRPKVIVRRFDCSKRANAPRQARPRRKASHGLISPARAARRVRSTAIEAATRNRQGASRGNARMVPTQEPGTASAGTRRAPAKAPESRPQHPGCIGLASGQALVGVEARENGFMLNELREPSQRRCRSTWAILRRQMFGAGAPSRPDRCRARSRTQTARRLAGARYSPGPRNARSGARLEAGVVSR